MRHNRVAPVVSAALLGALCVRPVQADGLEGKAASERLTLSSPVSVEEVSSLKLRLLQMDALRAGADTPFAEVEKQGQELLQRYTRPVERAQIYFGLAQVYAQSDIRHHPDRVTRYARLALASERDPIQRGILYSYLGSAAEVDPTRLTFAAQRTNAAQVWLQGYKELLPLHLPAVAPELPVVNKLGDGADPARQRQLLHEHELQMKARLEAERLEKLVHSREIFVQQLKEAYARAPCADEEITQLATRILRDKQAAETLLARILPQ